MDGLLGLRLLGGLLNRFADDDGHRGGGLLGLSGLNAFELLRDDGADVLGGQLLRFLFLHGLCLAGELFGDDLTDLIRGKGVALLLFRAGFGFFLSSLGLLHLFLFGFDGEADFLRDFGLGFLNFALMALFGLLLDSLLLKALILFRFFGG